MPGLVLDDFLDRIVVGNTNQLISEIWNQDKVIWQFDKIPPELNITDPTGTSTSAPTYVQNDSAYNYVVSGTVRDSSGIRSLTVNGYEVSVLTDGSWSKSLSLATNTTHKITVIAVDKAGNSITAIRYVRIEAYYQYAARIAGTTPQASLDATLKNTTVMTKIAANSAAIGIMKSKYSTQMNNYITSNYSDALNLANYNAGLKTYLFKNGNACANVTGGWHFANGKNDGSNIYIWIQDKTNAGYAGTLKAINFTNFSKLGFTKPDTFNNNKHSTVEAGLAFSSSLWFSQYVGFVSGVSHSAAAAGTLSGNGSVLVDITPAKTNKNLSGYNANNLYYVLINDATSYDGSKVSEVWIQ